MASMFSGPMLLTYKVYLNNKGEGESYAVFVSYVYFSLFVLFAISPFAYLLPYDALVIAGPRTTLALLPLAALIAWALWGRAAARKAYIQKISLKRVEGAIAVPFFFQMYMAFGLIADYHIKGSGVIWVAFGMFVSFLMARR
ncbi:MAG: hypothetical protein ACREXR_05550 [Gammaproteobacteria bacterium]